jgi:hypothetical protein
LQLYNFCRYIHPDQPGYLQLLKSLCSGDCQWGDAATQWACTVSECCLDQYQTGVQSKIFISVKSISKDSPTLGQRSCGQMLKEIIVHDRSKDQRSNQLCSDNFQCWKTCFNLYKFSTKIWSFQSHNNAILQNIGVCCFSSVSLQDSEQKDSKYKLLNLFVPGTSLILFMGIPVFESLLYLLLHILECQSR